MPSVYFQTFGCQMNVADSDALLRALAARGYEPVTSPDNADLIVVNTCSVREHAEVRAQQRIAEYAGIKKKRPHARLWVIGCMAERLGETLTKKISGIDAVIGAPELGDAEAAVQRYLDKDEYGAAVPVAQGVSEFVPVMRGCDNYCAYCVVPFVRGRETSIPAGDIERTVQLRVQAGVREVTFLGQNVNSYNDHGIDFPDLLRRIAAIDGLLRVRFTTSHPKDLSEKLVRTIAETPTVCRHVHLPVQSGSDRILSLMNRRYTAEHYCSLIESIRKLLPDADITTDLLVGFPSETDADFAATLKFVEQVRFTAAFMFAYSARQGTAAAELEDDVPRETKIARLNRLIKLQTEVTRSIYGKMVGQTLAMMVYGRLEKRGGEFLKGQDMGCKRILIPCADVKAGTILQVRAIRSSGMTLIAERT
ncbi:MAG: tRNA (N6-isopentenyl adenosine(37)-C2)-methylthiotransferase MiaB [Chitinispirillaceae bacterium]|jgi:tRNA-2-methylthio-N6-dimethylallyladenosine synthase